MNRLGNTIAAALALNLSRSGIAIRTISPLAPSAKLRVRFRLPGSKKDIDVDAIVCWSESSVGMGLRFERVDEADRVCIDEFVDSTSSNRGASDRGRCLNWYRRGAYA